MSPRFQSGWLKCRQALDPQSNLSQYFLGAQKYLSHISDSTALSVVNIFEQFSAPTAFHGAPIPLQKDKLITHLYKWSDGSLIDIITSRLELAFTLRNPSEKSHLLPRFIAEIQQNYDLIIIDCAPTESILTTSAYKSSRYIIVPVRPEFLATIGLPLLARSISEFKMIHQDQKIDIAGILFNGKRRSNPSPEQISSTQDVIGLAKTYNWPVFDNEAYHSDSYQTGSRSSDPIFLTPYARSYVKKEFKAVGKEFLTKIGMPQ